MLFVAKYEIDPETGCWMWMASTNPKGYGYFWGGRRMHLAHRWHWESAHGPVPPGHVLDHFVCTTPGCVNLAHLRTVTHRENALRSDTSMASQRTAQIECVKGHPFDEANTQHRPGGDRGCRTCHRERTRQRRSTFVAQPRA